MFIHYLIHYLIHIITVFNYSIHDNCFNSCLLCLKHNLLHFRLLPFITPSYYYYLAVFKKKKALYLAVHHFWNARTREAEQECLQLLVICFHKLWNWKFTLRMNLLFQINTRQLFCPFGYSSVVSSTAWYSVCFVWQNRSRTSPVPIF